VNRHATACVLVCALLFAGCSEPPATPALPRLVKVFVVGDSVESEPPPVETPKPLVRDPAALAFDAAGRIMTVLIQQGERVSTGQALARLDPSNLSLAESSARIQYNAALAELEFAESDFQRYVELFRKGFISSAEIDRRRSQVQLARARFESSADQLGFLTLRAIEPGVVTAVTVATGASVAARQVVVRLALDSPSATADPIVAPVVRSATVTRQRMVRIPLSAVVGGNAVYKLRTEGPAQARLERQSIRTGAVTEQWVEVISGLVPGDRIVAAGTHAVADGEIVRLDSR
jgi:multidrug efflux pump subunit AcrA (membrane-fusion protein)